MANYNNPNFNYGQVPNGMNPNSNMQQQIPVQFPYGNNNMLLNYAPYDNGMGNRRIESQNLLAPNQFLKCRPVSSKEEARAFQIDLDGSLWVFTDLGNGKIYTKQVNNDGTATFKTYSFVEDELPQHNSNEYVTKDEFNRVIQTLMASIQQPTQQQNSNDGKSATLMNFS